MTRRRPRRFPVRRSGAHFGALGLGVRRSLLVVTLAAVTAGCGGTRWRRENVFATSGLYIYQEWKEIDGERVPLRYRHPIEVAPEKLAVLFSKIIYRKDSMFGDATDEFVFEPEQVEVGALGMSAALETLSPDERLRFLFVKRSFTSLLTGIKGTSGVIFSEREGTLELAFDRVHTGMADSDENEPTRFSFPYEPTEFDSLSPLRVDDDGGVTHHVDPVSAVEYPRWLEVELAAIEVPERRPAPPAEVAGSAPVEGTAEDAADTAAANADSPASARDAEYADLKASLDLLERLRGDGVISETEYAERRKRVLDQALGEAE